MKTMKNIGRRTFLRGLGASALALPWMESLAVGSKNYKIPQRAAFYYVPIGVVRKTFFPGEGQSSVQRNFNNDNFDAESTRSNLGVGLHDLKLTPTMKPLDGLKDKVTLITGLDRTFQPGTDVHAQCASCFLSSASPFSLKHTPYPQARSLDHILQMKLVKILLLRLLNLAVIVTMITRNRFSLIIFLGMGRSMWLPRCGIHC